ncbi:MAG: lysophospholipid acyltransferase family protein [Deltaproteobacteria bacterium]|nr:lysophospholipid acyltransferase family protein [Deltaproteobacteria bacterium]
MIKELSRFAIRCGLIPIAYGILRLYLLTVRLRSEHEEELLNHLHQGGKGIAAVWHQRILLVVRYVRRFSKFSPAVMISRSRDGDLIADVYRRLNFRPVRGSSSRGGREALAAMVKELSVHPAAVHVLDGPRGPRGLIKAGIIRMAQLSGAPIIPVYISVNRAWILRSWDRFLIPKPFSTVWVRMDKPIPVPAELDDTAFEALRLNIEKKMRDNQDEDDRKHGWGETLF